MTDGDALHIIERRRLRRRVAFWRLVAIAGVVAVAAILGWRVYPAGDHVARVAVAGPIYDDPDRTGMLRDLAADDSVRAVIVRIDSPGGTVAGSEALYEALRGVAARKPVVAVMGEAAASGGYITALAADHIVARGATMTGSIGVIAEYPNVAVLLDKVGVAFTRQASGPLKAEPSPFRAPSDAVLAANRAIIEDAYNWFLGLVAERRGLSAEAAREVGDGRVFTGRQALAAGLIDAIGGEPEARDWLSTARGISSDLPLREAEVDRDDAGWLDLLGGATARGVIDAMSSAPRLMAVLR